jgi:hypothetical protein
MKKKLLDTLDMKNLNKMKEKFIILKDTFISLLLYIRIPAIKYTV